MVGKTVGHRAVNFRLTPCVVVDKGKPAMTFRVAAFLLLGASSAQAQQNLPPIYFAPLQPLSPSKRGVIFPAKLAREFGEQCSRASPSGWWTSVAPSRQEIARLERALGTWMKVVKRQQAPKRWSGRVVDYHFQYGALVRGKTRLIYLNAAPVFEPENRQLWRRGATVVCDGGAQNWGAEFNPQNGRFQNISFNGPPEP